MGYYSDLDDDLGAAEEAERDLREREFERRSEAAARKRLIKNEVDKQLKKLGVTTEKKKETGGAKIEVSCLCCGNKFTARVADRKRGWAKFCSKSCKAIKQKG